MSLHVAPTPQERSILDIVERQEQYMSVAFVKAFIESASKHEGPLNGDALLLQMMKAANVLPVHERQAVTAYLASIPAGTLKKLERPNIGSELESALAEGFAETVGKEIIKPLIIGGLVAAGVCTVPVSVPAALTIGSATVVASYVSNPAVKFVVCTSKTAGDKCLKLVEKEGARKLKSGLHAGVKRAGDAVTATYDSVSKIVFRKKTAAIALIPQTQTTDKSLLSLENALIDEDSPPVLLLSKPGKRAHPIVQEITPEAEHKDKKRLLKKS